MKRNLLTLAIVNVLLSSVVLVGAQNIELRGTGIYYAPGGAAATGSDVSDLREIEWDAGTGLEIQGIYWLRGSLWGIGASIGLADWDVEDYEGSWTYRGEASDETIAGDAQLTVIGISAFYKLFQDHGASGNWHGSLEGGVRFVSVDSDIKGATGVSRGGQTWGVTQIDIDDSVLGVFGLDIALALSDTISLFGHGGIQFDLNQGSAHRVVPGLDRWGAGDTEFLAVYGKGGVSINF